MVRTKMKLKDVMDRREAKKSFRWRRHNNHDIVGTCMYVCLYADTYPGTMYSKYGKQGGKSSKESVQGQAYGTYHA